MKQQPALTWLVPLIAVLALLAAGFGLFTPNDGNPISFTTARGETVELWGQGLYKYDTPIGATGFTSADVITLILAIPTLVISSFMYRRGSLRGGLLLTGVLSYFLYNYTSMGFGAAYNNMFLVYTLIFGASLYGLIVALLSFDLKTFPGHFGAGLPRNGIGVFLIISGIILSLIWLVLSIVPALLVSKAPPEAYYYTTFITGIIDIGIVAPALILGGVLIRRGAPFGYLLAATMLVFTCILGANLTAAGIIQVAKEVITIGQAMAFTVPFVILTLIAIWFTVVLFRNFSEKPYEKKIMIKPKKEHRNERHSSN
jgi:hypothetical protein